MKQLLTLLFLVITIVVLFAQNSPKSDSHSANQNAVIRIEGSAQNGWVKSDYDAAVGSTTPASGNDNVSYSSTAEGIFVTINNGTNKIRLYALTGQLLLNGDLTQGRFFIPARRGIYFLKVNNISYKVICK